MDARRLAFLRELYKEAGLDDEKAASYAFLHMSFVIGGRILQSNGPKGEAELGCKVGEEFLVP